MSSLNLIFFFNSTKLTLIDFKKNFSWCFCRNGGNHLCFWCLISQLLCFACTSLDWHPVMTLLVADLDTRGIGHRNRGGKVLTVCYSLLIKVYFNTSSAPRLKFGLFIGVRGLCWPFVWPYLWLMTPCHTGWNALTTTLEQVHRIWQSKWMSDTLFPLMLKNRLQFHFLILPSKRRWQPLNKQSPRLKTKAVRIPSLSSCPRSPG